MGLDFKLISESKDDIITTVLENRGIEKDKQDFFRNPKDMMGTLASGFWGSYKLCRTLMHSMAHNDKIGILIDGDADGFCSAALMYKWLLSVYNEEKVELLSMPEKTHGLILAKELIINSGVKTLIVPDAGSNDFDAQNELIYEYDMNILIIDHHEIDNEQEAYDSDAIIVNCHLSKNSDTNVNFTGVGMVYEELKLLHENMGGLNPEDMLDIFALGQVADSSDISDLEIREGVLQGLRHLDNPLMKQFIDETPLEKRSAHKLSFSIIPKINAVSRVGTREERIETVKALAGYYDENETVEVERRRKNYKTNKMEKTTLQWSRYEYIVDKLGKLKTKQDAEVKKAIKILSENQNITRVATVSVIDKKDLKHSAITGLIANKLISKYERPALVLVNNDNGSLSGSGRGFEKIMSDFRQYCLDTNLFKLAQGHENAFGVEIDANDVQAVVQAFKNAKIETDNSYHVDRIYFNDVDFEDLQKTVENEQLFGGKVNEPRFGFKNLEVDKNLIRKRGKVLSFDIGKVQFITFNGTALYEQIVNSGFEKTILFDIYGKAAESTWGKKQLQVIIDDIEKLNVVIMKDSVRDQDSIDLENEKIIF